MKTLYLLDDPSRDKHFHFYLLEGLKGAGFFPRVVYFCGRPPAHWRDKGLEALSFRLPPALYKNFNPLPVIRLAGLIKRFEPRVIHVQRHRPLIYTGLALKMLRQRIPLLYTIRLSNLVRTRARRFAFSLVEDRISYVIAVSRGAGEDFLKSTGFPRKRLRIIPNGLDPSPFDLPLSQAEARRLFSLPEDGFLFGMVARFRKVKDHPGLLRAFSAVQGKMPRAYLVLVGDGPEEGRIRELSHTLGLNDKVIFLGRLEPGEIPKVLKAFDVFVHPTFREGMPAAVLEAMAAGLPVIATEAEGITDIFDTPRKFGRLLSCGDQEALAESLLAFYRLPPAKLKALGQEARRRLEEEFTHEKMVKRNVELYLELTG